MARLVPIRSRGFVSPFKGIDDFYDLVDRFFESGTFPTRSTVANETFKLDVQEGEDGYKILAELPGVSKEDVTLELTEEGRLKIAVERTETTEEQGKNYVHRERKFNSMSRHVYLEDAATDNIKAKLENGILTIDVAKRDKAAQSRKIDIE